MLNIPKFPPDIVSSIQKMAAQEIEFFKEAMKLDLKSSFVNLLDVPVDWTSLAVKLGTPNTIWYDSQLLSKVDYLKTTTSAITSFGSVYYSDAPGGITQSLNIAMSATAIDNKLGDSSSSTSGIAETSGMLTTYHVNMTALSIMVNSYITDQTIKNDTQIVSPSKAIPNGNIRNILDMMDQTCGLVSSARTKMTEQKEKVEKFAKLSSLKSNMNIPSANFIMAGDMSAEIPKPPAIKESLLKLLQLPGKFK